MSYDADDADPTAAPCLPADRPVPSPLDPLAILTMLELAALELSPTAGATFGHEELVAKAHEVWGPDGPQMQPEEVEYVLADSDFLLRLPGRRYAMK